MAKPDIDKQIEQIRERLIVLNREAIVCPQPNPAKRRSHTFLTLICAVLFFLYPACLLYTSPSPRDRQKSRMPSSA